MKIIRKSGTWPVLLMFALMGFYGTAQAERLSLSGLKSDLDEVDQRLTNCEQGIGGACPGTQGPEGPRGPEGPEGPPGPAADAEPPLPPVIGAVLLGNDLDGDSVKYPGGIDIRQISFDVTGPTSSQTGGGSGTSRPDLSAIQLIFDDQTVSPRLMLVVAQGTHLADATIFLEDLSGGSGMPLEIQLTEVYVTSFQRIPARRDGEPSLVSIGLLPARIEVIGKQFSSFYNQKTEESGSCAATQYDFVLEINAPAAGGPPPYPIDSYDLGVSNAFNFVGGGGGSVMSSLSPVRANSAYIPDLVCLFGAVVAGNRMSVSIEDHLPSGDSTIISLSNAITRLFALSSNAEGEISIGLEFDYEEISLAFDDGSVDSEGKIPDANKFDWSRSAGGEV